MKLNGLILAAALLISACGPAAQSGQDKTEVSTAKSELPTIEVWKSPSCQCCSKWIEHLQNDGFTVIAHNENAMNPLKTRLGVPQDLASCHTAVVDGYVIEGHVPAQDIRKLLREKPKALGLAVPGMPIGSPGMEQGDEIERYETLLFNAEGSSVFAIHGAP
jgi:hypothetical protein